MRVSVRLYSGGKLPYIDNLVNFLIIADGEDFKKGGALGVPELEEPKPKPLPAPVEDPRFRDTKSKTKDQEKETIYDNLPESIGDEKAQPPE